MVMHWNEFCEEKWIVEGEYACPLNFVKRYFYQIYTNFPLPFPPFSTSYQTGTSSLDVATVRYAHRLSE